MCGGEAFYNHMVKSLSFSGPMSWAVIFTSVSPVDIAFPPIFLTALIGAAFPVSFLEDLITHYDFHPPLS